MALGSALHGGGRPCVPGSRLLLSRRRSLRHAGVGGVHRGGAPLEGASLLVRVFDRIEAGEVGEVGGLPLRLPFGGLLGLRIELLVGLRKSTGGGGHVRQDTGGRLELAVEVRAPARVGNGRHTPGMLLSR